MSKWEIRSSWKWDETMHQALLPTKHDNLSARISLAHPYIPWASCGRPVSFRPTPSKCSMKMDEGAAASRSKTPLINLKKRKRIWKFILVVLKEKLSTKKQTNRKMDENNPSCVFGKSCKKDEKLNSFQR